MPFQNFFLTSVTNQRWPRYSFLSLFISFSYVIFLLRRSCTCQKRKKSSPVGFPASRAVFSLADFLYCIKLGLSALMEKFPPVCSHFVSLLLPLSKSLQFLYGNVIPIPYFVKKVSHGDFRRQDFLLELVPDFHICVNMIKR